MGMEAHRKIWNEQQGEFREALLSYNQHDRALQLFLIQHAMLHSARIAQNSVWSFEDEIFGNLDEEKCRRVPVNCDHSIAWCLWHMARIEDVTMNMLVGGVPQIMGEKWLKSLRISAIDTGNMMDEANVFKLSSSIDLDALRSYRLAVGRKTREIVLKLKAVDLKQKVDPTRLQRLLDEGIVLESAKDLIDYWSKRTIAGMLLMPPTRHNFVHLNEASRLKRRRQ
jgi:hypothetical protein